MPRREAYEYDEAPASAILRPLDPTEHNMERLNRVGFGAGVVYQTARVRGRLDRARLEAAVGGLTRHGVVRARVVRGPDGLLGFAEVADCRLEIQEVEVDDPARAWQRHVEMDMNAGPVATHRGSAFRVFVLGNGEEHAITLAAPHHVWDGVSSVALMRELLEQIARPRVLPPISLREVESPFVAHASPQLRASLRAIEREVVSWAAADPFQDPRRAALRADLEELEANLLATGDDRELPRELLEVQRLLVEVERARRVSQSIAPDGDPGLPPARAGNVSTGLVTDVIGADVMTPLAAAARRRGLTVHGAFGAAMLFAHAARHWALTGVPDGPQLFALASPVNLRKQFHPQLADDDVRMAVDVSLTSLEVGPADDLWEVAARIGAAVTRDVERRRALGSWFRTERRPADLPLAGVPIPLLSNVGRVAVATRFGDLELVELHACMATHSMFQIAMLIQTLGAAANLSYYHELPTISRESIVRLASTVRATLERAAAGANPVAGPA